MSKLRVSLPRKALYDLVWSKPISQVAKEFGISDVGLAKRCRAHEIPLPGLGYWRKKETGKDVHQPRLPEFKGSDEVFFTVEIPDEDEFGNVKPKTFPEYVVFEKNPENVIRVPAVLSDPHRFVAAAKKHLERAKPDYKMGWLVARGAETLDIRVCRDSVDRALRIMDALIKALEERGFPVNLKNEEGYSTFVQVNEEKLAIGLDELLRFKKSGDEWTGGDERYAYLPSGRLTLKIRSAEYMGCRYQWRDGVRLKLEDCLNAFVIGLQDAAELERTRRLEREELDRRFREERARAEELRKRQRDEMARLQQLETEVSNWRKAQEIRAYVSAVESDAVASDGSIEPGSDLANWISWARSHADRFDPLAEGPPSVLDEPVPNDRWNW